MTEIRPCFAVFRVDDLEDSARFYRDGLGIDLHPNDEARYLDPDGNLVSITEQTHRTRGR